MNKFLKFLKKNINYIGAFALGLMTLAGTGVVHAATDADLSSALASSTAVLSDNKGAVLGWFAGIFGIVIVIVIAKKLLGLGKGQIAGSIGGGRRRR